MNDRPRESTPSPASPRILGAPVLAIETSNPSACGPGPGPSVALRSGGAVVVEPLRPAAPGTRGGHDDDLIPAIDRVFARVGLRPRDLAGGAVAVSIGPGGFTGLRIACAAGKMIAEAAGAACIAVPTAAALVRRVDVGALAGGRVGVSLAVKGDSAWVQVFDPGHAPFSPSGVVTAAEFALLAERDQLRMLITDRFLPEGFRTAAARLGVELVPPCYDAAAVLEAAEELPRIDPAALVPLYPREPEAVTLWRQRCQRTT
ncbi:MAG: tRNA (adenosine(37)-N6)-threonylcarbamoyltransferase complex dimerization subunit type 1 TsaB [Phycisphaerales bacterium]|nr:tRNA (adenosine(37)-N6)-threonylcarbamoyltransferase complex dimerization subunit type 1 TsaB [Phycisphaerales bacterium]